MLVILLRKRFRVFREAGKLAVGLKKKELKITKKDVIMAEDEREEEECSTCYEA